MFGFYLKKCFCDGWDNLFQLIIVNIVTLFVGFAIFIGYSNLVALIPQSADNMVLPAYLLIVLLLFLIFLLYAVSAFSFGEIAATIADFGGLPTVDFFKKIPSVMKDALLYAGLATLFALVSYVCIVYYFTQGSMLTFFIGGIFLWIDITVILAMQWFVPVRSIMHNNFKKCLKKCFILTLDNLGFSFAMALYSIVMIAISIFCIGFIPSISGITLAQVEALRIRLYKYDYLEEHPEIKGRARKHVPWEELIFDDRESLGPRPLKSFLFPWKDGQNVESI